ncbi:MAG: SDR family oxidoreductase [Solirubrobacterales bacterium]|nr:SDR family oxidoreductase [Solirubrobacterales bacterium]
MPLKFSAGHGSPVQVIALRDERQRSSRRVAVVTGAGQGIGREIALAFGREHAQVVLAARSRERLETVADEIRAAGGQALAVPTDVTDPASVNHLGDTVLGAYGTIDVLVNNSGVAGPTAVLWEQTLKEWEETFRAGVFLCCKAFLPTMVANQRGCVVVIGSMTGKRPLHGRTPYAASKMALIGMVRTLATEAGPAGVRVNLISPGPVTGERLDRVIAAQASSRNISEDEARRQFASASPLERLVEPVDIADAVLFLASERAASITGENLNVSAGIGNYG